MDKLKALTELDLFHGLNPSILEPVSRFFIPRRYERNQTIWREGYEAVTFVFIVEGYVKIAKRRNDGGELIVGIFGEDEVIGHMSVYRQERYPASAYALGETTTLEIHRSHFQQFLNEHPPLLRALFKHLTHWNTRMVQRLHEIAVLRTEQRLAMIFQELALVAGRRVRLENGEMGVHIALPLSRSDIADLINVRTETAIRHMSKWNRTGPVRTESRGFTIVDRENLERLASGDNEAAA